MAKHKFNAKKTVVDGIEFPSKAEARRFGELKILQKAGEITGLELQPVFKLLPTARRSDGVAERGVKYLADFAYVRKDGVRVVEDVKSPATRTPEYVLKRKMMLHLFGITVMEVS